MDDLVECHRKIQDAIDKIHHIYEKGQYDDVWKLNKHLDGDINTIRLLLIDVKITLPEGDEDDTFLRHSDQD